MVVLKAKAGDKATTPDAGMQIAAFPLITFAVFLILRRFVELVGLGHPGLAGSLALAAGLSFAATIWAFGARQARRLTAAALLWILFGALAAYGFRAMPDGAWDSETYHLPAVLRLLQGWRPIAEPTDLPLANAYANGVWTVMAGFDSIFGLESGRAVTPILLIAGGALLFAVLTRAGYGRGLRVAFCVLLSANVVVVTQFFTSMVDGTLSQLALIQICTLVLCLDDRRRGPALLACAAAIFFLNVKLTAIFFFVLAAVSTILALIICGKSWRLLAWAKEHRGQLAAIALAGMVAFFFVGWRPYMVNLIEHGTLVYPGKQDIGLYSQTITGGQIPPNLVDAGRGTRLAALFFGATADNGDVIYKIPGTFTRSELNVTPDGRNGGFGPLFGAEAVLSGLALIVALTRPQRRPGAAETAFFLFFVLCTVLFPECWWARYVPMAWGIPLAAILLARSVRRDRIGEVLGAAVMLVAAANIVIAGNASISSAARFRHDYRGKLKAMIHSADPIYLSRGAMTATGRLAADELWQERLREHGQTNVIFLERDDCVPMIPLSADMVRCKPPAVNSAHE